MDIISKEKRSWNMSKIRGKNTKPELTVRKLLWKKGYRYRIHSKGVPGNPDIIFKRWKKVIFVNGCFWHKHSCKNFRWPKSNMEFWKKKIGKNIIRDKSNYLTLKNNGWDYMIIWECELIDEVNLLIDLDKFLGKD